MNLLSANKITKRIASNLLFEDISFGINEGEKIGLIGVNGSGKSSLIRMILGKEEPDSGEITRNRELKISHLGQNPEPEEGMDILEYIFRSQTPIIKTIREYERACAQLEKKAGEAQTESFEKAHAEMDRQNAWEYEANIKSILKELGIAELSTPVNQLSGGMFKKVNLVHALIEESNLLILDEPTNHLDIDTILYLQNHLQTMNKALFLVTHDRYFLEEVVGKIFEIDKKTLFTFPGNYDYYLEKKVELEESLSKTEDKAKSFLRRELEWLKRQPKARGTKQKARIDRIEEVRNREKHVKEKDIELSSSGRRLGKKIIEIKNLRLGYGDKCVLDNFSHVFKLNERLGIVGANGAGKSSLLNAITERLEPISGHIDRGINTHIAYFDQTSKNLEPQLRVIDFIKKNSGEYIYLDNGDKITASKMLERFLFDSRLQYTQIEDLSGGEKRRLYLVYLLMKNPNFLILDEPTNDLDIKTLSILENYLLEFKGCLLLVSHDRYFMNRLVDSLLIFEGEGIVSSFPGNYFEYLENKKEQEQKGKKEKQQENTKPEPKKDNTKKIPFKVQKQIDSLEKEIESLEKEKSDLEEFMTKNASDFQIIQEKNQRLNVLETELKEKLETWETLLIEYS